MTKFVPCHLILFTRLNALESEQVMRQKCKNGIHDIHIYCNNYYDLNT